MNETKTTNGGTIAPNGDTITALTKYRVFIRTCASFPRYSAAKKRTVERGLTLEEARRCCAAWNGERSPGQKRRGTMAEFERE